MVGRDNRITSQIIGFIGRRAPCNMHKHLLNFDLSEFSIFFFSRNNFICSPLTLYSFLVMDHFHTGLAEIPAFDGSKDVASQMRVNPFRSVMFDSECGALLGVAYSFLQYKYLFCRLE